MEGMEVRYLVIFAIASVLLIPAPIFAPSHPEYVGFERPYKQIFHGVLPQEVTCNLDLVLVIKYNGVPACVYENTALTLEEWGWGTIFPNKENMHQNS